MSFRTKILAVLTLVGLLPLALLGFLTFTVNRAELERTAGAAQEALAQEAARGAEHWVARAVEGLRLSVSILPFDQLRPAELRSALQIPYRQLQFIDVLALLDEDGRLAFPPLMDPRREATQSLAADDVASFLAAVPLNLALQAGTALGAPYRSRGGEAHVAVAVRVSTTPARVVAAQFSLAGLQREMADVARAPTVAFLSTVNGNVLASAAPAEAPRTFAALTSAAEGAHAPYSRTLAGPDGAPWLASAAPVGNLGWVTVLAQPASVALGPALRVRRYTLFWAAVALLLTGALGLLVSRSLTVPIERLKTSARALQEGRYGEPVPVHGRDELGEFARAFGHMAREIRRRDEEIRAWNSQLQQRVEEKGEELKAAQDQILRARRLAAIGSLGAGVAHEINNPLMAIGGFLALLERDADEKQALTVRKAQEQVQRVARIVEGLQQFAAQERAVQGRRFPLAAPVKNVLQRYAAQLEQSKVALAADLEVAVREVEGDPIQIEQVVEHLVRNALQAMPSGGKLEVRVAALGGDSLKLVVADSGRGISPAARERIFDPFFSTKDGQGKGAGLGLSISHSIVEAHHGRILVDSVEGRGSIFTVVLPAAAAPAHLS